MDGSGLSPRETQALAEIEAELSADTRLERMLATMRRPKAGPRALGALLLRPRGYVVAVFFAACVGLLAGVIRTGSPVLVGVLAACWIVTVSLGLALLCRWVRVWRR
ncbi:hypothetical protein [Yinghuangia seranimata]|uniref:hypothetical protein n=1 Tax=Yinghuangia seranimata TaxID=408067 RepID=UPI00248AFA52|nr:hypothetical protein [Yinghuangia seranimata]MDI2130705.1 hypothetical protein [Yinghuangia seranimata]